MNLLIFSDVYYWLNSKTIFNIFRDSKPEGLYWPSFKKCILPWRLTDWTGELAPHEFHLSFIPQGGMEGSGGQCRLRLGRMVYLNEYSLIYITAYWWLSFILHSPSSMQQARFRLLYNTLIIPIPIMRLLQPSLRTNVYNTQVKRTVD